MEQGFVDILKKLTDEQGKEVLLNIPKCKALLADYTKNEYKKESRLLLQALEAGVQKVIEASQELPLCKKQQIRLLHEDYSLAEKVAVDVVDTLAFVLRGDTTRTEVQSSDLENGQLAKDASEQAADDENDEKYGIAKEYVEAALERARNYFENEDYNNAINEFNELIKILPNVAILYHRRADAWLRKNEYDLAIKDYTEVIRLDPHFVHSYAGRGYAYFQKGQPDYAIKDYTEAIRLDPNNAFVYAVRGDAYRMKGLYDQAIRDYTEAIRLDPNNVVAYANRGTAYRMKDQYDQAISDCTEAIRLVPNYALAYVVRGDAYCQRGQYDQAIRNFDEAIRLNPNDTSVYSFRDLAYKQLNQKNQVIQNFENSPSLNPKLTGLKQEVPVLTRDEVKTQLKLPQKKKRKSRYVLIAIGGLFLFLFLFFYVIPKGSLISRLSTTSVEEIDGFVYIKGGIFTMGSPVDEPGRFNDEVQHQVTVSSFYMGKYQVSQKEYEEITGNNPSHFKGPDLPVDRVTWYNAVEYCNNLSRQEGLTPAYTIDKNQADPNNTHQDDDLKWTVTWHQDANGYRLPTEAEWEYACRAETTTPFNTGNNITIEQANFDGSNTIIIGSFAPNAWDLYDMHGNVYEWCWDWYGDYTSEAQTDPQGSISGHSRITRGGCWENNSRGIRSACRTYNLQDYRDYRIGFRIVRNEKQVERDGQD